PGHPGAQRTRGERGVHGGVELAHGDLVVVPQRDVRGGEQRPDAVEVAVTQPAHDLQHAGVLGDDVPYATTLYFIVHSGQCDGELVDGDVSQRGHAQHGRRLLTRPASPGVLTVDEFVRGAG